MSFVEILGFVVTCLAGSAASIYLFEHGHATIGGGVAAATALTAAASLLAMRKGSAGPPNEP